MIFCVVAFVFVGRLLKFREKPFKGHSKDGEIEHISTYLEIERNLSRATARMVKSEAVRKI